MHEGKKEEPSAFTSTLKIVIQDKRKSKKRKKGKKKKKNPNRTNINSTITSILHPLRVKKRQTSVQKGQKCGIHNIRI